MCFFKDHVNDHCTCDCGSGITIVIVTLLTMFVLLYNARHVQELRETAAAFSHQYQREKLSSGVNNAEILSRFLSTMKKECAFYKVSECIWIVCLDIYIVWLVVSEFIVANII